MFPPGVGGSEMYAYELANALGDAGHEVDVYTQSVTKEDRPVSLSPRVSVERICHARNYLVTFETLYYSLKTRLEIDLQKYDVIHGTLMPASTIALSLRLGNETPIVVTSHGTSIGETCSHTPEIPTDYLLRYFFHPMNVVLDSIAGRTADHIIAISKNTKKQLDETYRFDSNKLSLIPHGVDTDRFYPRKESHEAVSPNKTSFLFVGRLASRKGVSRVIKALTMFRGEKVELLVAGSGRHKERLKRLAGIQGVSNRVRFLGYVPDDELPQLYSSADVFVFPSRYEGFGLVFLEAMACGTPVIGTPVGGVPDVIENGETGFVIDEEINSLSERLRYCHENPKRVQEMSNSARQKAKNMDWSRVAAKVETVYEQVSE